jgi:putative solute:sodium symporter small subunit
VGRYRSRLPDNQAMSSVTQDLFWSRTLRATAGLLLLWVVVSVGVPWFARDLAALGAPSGSADGSGFAAMYWLAAKGTLLFFLAIIVLHAWWMDRLEAQCLAAAAAAAEEASAPAGANKVKVTGPSERD